MTAARCYHLRQEVNLRWCIIASIIPPAPRNVGLLQALGEDEAAEQLTSSDISAADINSCVLEVSFLAAWEHRQQCSSFRCSKNIGCSEPILFTPLLTLIAGSVQASAAGGAAALAGSRQALANHSRPGCHLSARLCAKGARSVHGRL